MTKYGKILADLHTHTIFSGHAFSTIEENIAAAHRAGLRYLAITDHYYCDGSALDKKNEITRLRYLERDINPTDCGVYVIGGGEFNLGQTPYNPEKIAQLMWKPIGLHSFFMDIPSVTLEQLYQMYVDAASDYSSFAHIERGFHKLEGRRFGVELCPEVKDTLEKLVVLAKDKGVLLEVNEASILRKSGGVYERMKYWLGIARENGNQIYLGTDAHYSSKIGHFENTLELLGELDYPPELILNLDEDKIKAYCRNL